MSSKLFVGGFPYVTSEAELTRLFSSCGEVKSLRILKDRDTNRSRGLAFIEMGSPEQAQAAIDTLDRHEIGGRMIFVTVQREKDEAPPSEARPGFVERRSGKDRRKGWGPLPPGGERRFGERKGFADRPKFGERKPWGDKKPWERKKFNDKPAFGDKPKFGAKKPWERKKPWADKPASGDKPRYEKKPWQDKPADKPFKKVSQDPPRKKWGAGGPGAGKNPWRKPKKFG